MSWLSRFSLVPSFPPLTGPYEVGTVDVEIAAADIKSASPEAPPDAPATVSYRIFYPCQKPTVATRPVRWIPKPQKANLAGLISYIGAGTRLSEVISYLSLPAYRISLPVHRSASLLAAPTTTTRWPVTLFSHGLAGQRNLYSHLCASLSSHGQIIIALDHRDGSSPVQYVRSTPTREEAVIKSVQLPFGETPESFEGRDAQLRIRCWELGLVYQSLVDVDAGCTVTNMDENAGQKGEQTEVLGRFKEMLDLRPGKVIWAGHSFGAATVTQMIKSVWYAGERNVIGTKPLFVPVEGSGLLQQVRKGSPIALFDPWMMPFASPDQKGLWGAPLPACDTSDSGKGEAEPAKANAIAIVSEGFFKWKQNLNRVVQLLTPPRGSRCEPGTAWYATGSKHFNQSDFGVLFSWIFERFMKAGNGRELLEGNIALVNQMLRGAGIELAKENLPEPKIEQKSDGTAISHTEGSVSPAEGRQQIADPIGQALPDILDEKIWIQIPIDGNA